MGITLDDRDDQIRGLSSLDFEPGGGRRRGSGRDARDDWAAADFANRTPIVKEQRDDAWRRRGGQFVGGLDRKVESRSIGGFLILVGENRISWICVNSEMLACKQEDRDVGSVRHYHVDGIFAGPRLIGIQIYEDLEPDRFQTRPYRVR